MCLKTDMEFRQYSSRPFLRGRRVLLTQRQRMLKQSANAIIEKNCKLNTRDVANLCARTFGLVDVLQKPSRARIAVAAGNALNQSYLSGSFPTDAFCSKFLRRRNGFPVPVAQRIWFPPPRPDRASFALLPCFIPDSLIRTRLK